MGFKMGGRGTWYFASRHQDRIRAAIPIASLPDSASLAADWSIPIYVIHSQQDEAVPYGPVQTSVSDLQSSGVAVQLSTATGITHFDTGGFVPVMQAAVPWIQEAWE